jgi:hypothetical protein
MTDVLTKQRAEELGVVFEEITLREATSIGGYERTYPVLQATVIAGGPAVTYHTPIKGGSTSLGRTVTGAKAPETHEDILLRQVHEVLVQRGVIDDDNNTRRAA